MDKVRIEDIDGQIDSATVKRALTDALNAADVALNYYELAPGDSFAYGYHMHENQEEISVIQEGKVTFETEDEEIVATEDDERVVAVAIGASQETGKSEILRQCDACGERTLNTVERSGDGQVKITGCELSDQPPRLLFPFLPFCKELVASVTPKVH